MDDVLFRMPAQFKCRAATASFIVDLYRFFCTHGTSVDVSKSGLFGELPVPPEHLDNDGVEDCQAITSVLARAVENRYEVDWSAQSYHKHVGRNILLNPDHEDLLMRKYPPLIDVHEVLRRKDENLPVVDEPAVITDTEGGTLVWSLPEIVPECRRAEMLRAMRLLEGQLTINAQPQESPTKIWRTGNTYFTQGVAWKSGETLLYPAGFAQGHTGPKYNPSPSADSKSDRVNHWMEAFETSGGLLDGLLAVTHPELYREAQLVAQNVFRNHGACRFLMSLWLSCFSSIQVIVNRSTPLHRDISGRPGWLELLLTLGTYGETGVLQLRNLGVSLPYPPGSAVILCSRHILHGVPTVPEDRICYAFYMNKHLFKRVDAQLPGMCVLPPLQDDALDDSGEDADGSDSEVEGEGRGGHGADAE